MNRRDPDPTTAFLLRLLRALHAYGAPAHRLEAVAGTLARRLGLEGHVFSAPTAIIASFAPPERGETALLRVEPGGVHLEKLARLDALIDRALAGELDLERATDVIEQIEHGGERYGTIVWIACYGLASAAAARYFAGGWREMAVAGAIGGVTGVLAALGERRAGLARVVAPVAAIAAGLLASLAAPALGHLSPTLAAIAGLIVLVPGFDVTIAMTELGTQHLVSGTTRLAGATMVFLLLGFGLALGAGLGHHVVGLGARGAPVALPAWTLWAALPVSALSLSVLFRAPPDAFGPVLAVGALAFATVRLVGTAFGPELGMFLAALVAGVASNLYARGSRRPAAIPLVPAILLLVPGSLGLSSFTSLLARDVLVGVELAFRLVLLAVALAAGLVLSNVVAPPRRSM